MGYSRLPSRYPCSQRSKNLLQARPCYRYVIPRSTSQGSGRQGCFDFIRRIPVTSDGRSPQGAAAGLAPAYSFSAHVAEVEVDVETGLIKCTDVWAAHDCGKALNPLAVEGQIIGSCHMGLGQVLTEQMVYGRTGHLQNPNLLDYKIPSVHEMPNVTPIIIESCDPEGPFGAKEAGEGPLLPILPAVVNAVYDAIGIRINDLPLTPDKVWAAIAKKMKVEGIDDAEKLPVPRLDFSELQKKLEKRAAEHEVRDKRRQRSEDTDAYVNGVLFGFDPNLPLKTRLKVGNLQINLNLNNSLNLVLQARLG